MQPTSNADTCTTLPCVGRFWDDAYCLPRRKAALYGATVRVLCDVQYGAEMQAMFVTFILPILLAISVVQS